MEYISIQAQDKSGMWRTYSRVQNNSQRIRDAMVELQRQHPDYRIRAIDGDGRIVDML